MAKLNSTGPLRKAISDLDRDIEFLLKTNNKGLASAFKELRRTYVAKLRVRSQAEQRLGQLDETQRELLRQIRQA